jgi:alkylated DNA repair dioxygenase AlkB
MRQQTDLFETEPKYPAGFRYAPEFVSRAEERRLIAHLQRLEFKPFEFQGFLGKRRVVSFGWRYDFNGGGLTRTDDMPDFLVPLRERAAAFAGLQPNELQQVLLTEYQPGAPIGRHKDRSVFGEVVGISFLSACTFRFRRKAGAGWERSSLVLAPRSSYLLHGPARTEWEHSIPPVTEPRYSITFRNFRDWVRGK